MVSYKRSLLKPYIKMHFRTGGKGHPSPEIKALRALEIHQIRNAL